MIYVKTQIYGDLLSFFNGMPLETATKMDIIIKKNDKCGFSARMIKIIGVTRALFATSARIKIIHLILSICHPIRNHC